MINLDLNSESGADISDCKRYRYVLWRTWNANKPKCVFIMLNPSTADANKNDSTITRCINRANLLGFGGILVVNLFAYRTTYPSDLFSYKDNKIGCKNDDYIKYAANISDTIICAWGNGGIHQERDKAVKRILFNESNAKLTHIGLTKPGNPLHPIARGKCIPYEQQPIHWN